MTTPYFTKKFVEPSLYRGFTVLKVHVQSKEHSLLLAAVIRSRSGTIF